MGAKPRVPFDSEFVHLYTRGNNRAAIVFDEWDYEAWLRVVERTVQRFQWQLHAHCLMPNHYHLLVRASREAVSRGMRHLNGSIAQRVNVRYDRSGHVFEGPYREELIVDQLHLMEVCRYIPLNPVRARLCGRPEEWAWSSYRSIVGLEQPAPFVEVDFTRSLFGRGAEALGRYRRFVEDGIPSTRAMSRDLVAGHGGFGR